jgi:4-carboxymuconolactone decarboxylase
MNNKLALVLTAILVVSGTTKSETQNIETEGLNNKQKAIVTTAAFTASGNLPKLSAALKAGLDAGLTINEIKEILVQMYACAGFPRSLNGINTFMSVLEDREKKGIKDELGKEPSPLPANKSSVELGTENQTKLIGAPITGKFITFAPAIDQFLKGHLFGRDNLDWQSREIATVAALANLGGVNSQLQSHFSVALNTGLTEGQLKDLIGVIEAKVGKKQAENASEVLSKVDKRKSAPDQ